MTEKNDVVDWLQSNPDVFLEHPELLDGLNLPHKTNAASLIEYQIQRLRDQNAELGQRLDQLSGIASDNERLMRRLHRLTLEVMARRSIPAFLEQMFDKLVADFNADLVSLHLTEGASALAALERVSLHPDNRPEWFERALERGRIECGRLTRSKLDWLFGDQAEPIGSAALVPVAGSGLLAIGARSVDRFAPGMGTLFLELLAETIAFRLDLPDSERRKRA